MGVAHFGKYKLIAELGRGGMADVFLAVQAGPAGSGFRKLAVLKRLRQALADDPEFVSMLVDEARLAARLNHPNVVQTNEIGEFDGRHFIAMEYLDGQPLHRIQHRSAQREKNGQPPILTSEQQYIILMDALSGLQYAHELADFNGTSLEIVHRDVTPHNLFVTYEGQVKIVDFGIAKAVGRMTETRPGAIKGKVRYMAWEQAIGQPVDRRADVFSVGVMLWEAAVGRRMWQGMDDLQITQQLLAGDLPPSPRTVRPEVPEAIDRICRTSLALRAADRYQTAAEFRLELEQYLVESGALIDARRKLPLTVCELFADRRDEIRVVIETQLAAIVDEAPVSEHAVPSIGTVSQPSIPTALNVGISSEGSAVNSETGTSLAQQPAARGRSSLTTIGGVMLALAAIGFVAWNKGGVSIGKPAEKAASAEVQEVTLRVNVSPSTAKVIVDDGPAQGAPVNMTVRRSDRERVVRVEADGYEPKTERVTFARDVSLSIDLAKKAADAPSAAASSDRAKPSTSTAAVVLPWRPSTAKLDKPDPKRDGDPKAEHAPAPPPASVAAPAATAHPPPEGSVKNGRSLSLDNADPWGPKR